MSKLMEILNDVRPGCDFENSTNFLDDGFFDSLSIVTILTRIEEICDIEIDIIDIDEDDFASEESLFKMVERFGGDITLLK